MRNPRQLFEGKKRVAGEQLSSLPSLQEIALPFIISALDPEPFREFLLLDPVALQAHLAKRVRVTSKPGFPCRVSLADAEIGEEVLLIHYQHQTAASPFRASHAVYVRPGTAKAELSADAVPQMLRSRMLSLRAFDNNGMMAAAKLVDGAALEPALDEILSRNEVEYVHIHFATPGCYAARADRVKIDAPRA